MVWGNHLGDVDVRLGDARLLRVFEVVDRQEDVLFWLLIQVVVHWCRLEMVLANEQRFLVWGERDVRDVVHEIRQGEEVYLACRDVSDSDLVP